MNEYQFIFELIQKWNLSPLDLGLLVFLVFYVKSEDLRISVARAFGSDRIKQSKEFYDMVDSIKSIDTKFDSLNEVDLVLLKMSLRDDIENDLKNKYTTSTRRECILGRYSLYKARGGNSYIDFLLEKHKNLEVKQGS